MFQHLYCATDPPHVLNYKLLRKDFELNKTNSNTVVIKKLSLGGQTLMMLKDDFQSCGSKR